MNISEYISSEYRVYLKQILHRKNVQNVEKRLCECSGAVCRIRNPRHGLLNKTDFEAHSPNFRNAAGTTDPTQPRSPHLAHGWRRLRRSRYGWQLLVIHCPLSLFKLNKDIHMLLSAPLWLLIKKDGQINSEDHFTQLEMRSLQIKKRSQPRSSFRRSSVIYDTTYDGMMVYDTQLIEYSWLLTIASVSVPVYLLRTQVWDDMWRVCVWDSLRSFGL